MGSYIYYVHIIYKCVMIYFMCHFQWAIQCPNIYSNIKYHILMRVLWDEINIWIYGYKWSRLLFLACVNLTQSSEGLNRIKTLIPQSNCLWTGHWLSSALSCRWKHWLLLGHELAVLPLYWDCSISSSF